MLDTGCIVLSIDQSFVKEHKITMKPLHVTIIIYNTDRSHNLGDLIIKYVKLKVKIHNYVKCFTFVIINLGNTLVFIRYE